jgi:hypothetical protein
MDVDTPTSPQRSHSFLRILALLTSFFLIQAAIPARMDAVPPMPAPVKANLRGYLTARIDDSTVAILDDRIQLAKRGRIESHDATAGPVSSFAALASGQYVDAEGVWLGKHQFSAEHITVEPGLQDKAVHETAYLQEEPADGAEIAHGGPAQLKTDGEWLVLGSKTHREWPPPEKLPSSAASPGAAYIGRQVRYEGVRREDGKIDVGVVELHGPAPEDPYNNPHGLTVVPAKDPQTGIDILEFRRDNKVDGRLKLFEVALVRQYVSDLGTSLLPPGGWGTSRTLEFRFFVVEDPGINAQALPDGTVLVNTGLLGAVDNEAELAFVLSHEIAHVFQVHTWREANETRAARVGLTIAGIASVYYIGDMGIYLSKLGIAAVVNGHQRSLESQADRLGMQTVIDRGYDPRQAVQFLRIVIDRYGDRSTSKLWSNHDSSVLRGSFLTAQIEREYPQGHFDGARVDSRAFQAMREAMGPVKIE